MGYIQRTTPRSIRDRGAGIVAQNKVRDMRIDNKKDLVEARVIGSNANLYFVQYRYLNESSSYCNCPAYDKFGYCKHMWAVYVEANELYRPYIESQVKLYGTDDEDEYDYEAEYEDEADEEATVYGNSRLLSKPEPPKPVTGHDLFNSLTKKEASLHANELVFGDEMALETTIYIKPHISIDSYTAGGIVVDLKVGLRREKRRFVVKNLVDFLTIYHQQATFAISKARQFALGDMSFNAEDTAVLQMLMRIVGFDSYRPNNYFNDNRTMYIPFDDVPEFLALVQQQKELIVIDSGLKVHETVQLHQLSAQASPFVFEFEQSDDQYKLRIKKGEHIDLYDEWLLAQKNHLYYMTQKQRDIFVDLHALMDRAIYILHPELFDNYLDTRENTINALNRHDVELPFASLAEFGTVQRKLSDLGPFKGDDVPVDLHMEPVLHFGLNDAQITLQLKFKYGVKTYAKNELFDVTGTRDIQAESAIEKVANKLGFALDEMDFGAQPIFAGYALYTFFKQTIPLLEKRAQVIIDPQLAALHMAEVDLKPQVSVQSNGRFLDVNFDFGEIDVAEVDGILASLDEQKKYHVLDDDRIIIFDELDADLDAFRDLAQSIGEFGELKNGNMQVPNALALRLKENFADEVDWQTSDEFNTLVYDLGHPKDFAYAIPTAVQAKLRPYQAQGVQWLTMLDEHKMGGILADDMGLGKTLQMITFLVGKLQNVNDTALIVVPASVMYNWQEEFHKFAPEVVTTIIEGTIKQREALLNSKPRVMITSYGAFRSDAEQYATMDITYLVIDEAQNAKNSTTKTAALLRKLPVQNIFALSGTPVENRIEELWSIFSIVLPGLFPSKRLFKKLSNTEIAQRVKPFIMRREKDSVLTDLPAKNEMNLMNDLTLDQKKIYLAQLKQMQVKVQGMDSKTLVKNKIEILAGLTRLRQICDTPALYIDDYTGASGKLDQLFDLLETARSNGRRPLIFSQFTSMLDIVAKRMEEAGYDAFMLQGNTKANERQSMVNAFNHGEKDAFLISLKAGGTGLNLTGADMVILVDLWWNPAVEDQATARAHRMGQTKQVDVYRLVTKGTIEEKIISLQAEKRNLVDQVLAGTDQSKSLSEDEIRDILGV
ncbi:MAG: DEAD/DEAH box helicase [Lactobacillaceae bacterium]|jgi:superfamily II DNA or RNA helicase|nr:DEAD/DEAH box helicase [Lactobacillaceae bacterium]